MDERAARAPAAASCRARTSRPARPPARGELELVEQRRGPPPRLVAPLDAVEPADEAQELAAGELVVEEGPIGQVAGRRLGGLGLAADVVPVEQRPCRRSARAGPPSCGWWWSCRRRCGRGSRRRCPALDVEAEVVDRDERSVGPSQALDADHEAVLSTSLNSSLPTSSASSRWRSGPPSTSFTCVASAGIWSKTASALTQAAEPELVPGVVGEAVVRCTRARRRRGRGCRRRARARRAARRARCSRRGSVRSTSRALGTVMLGLRRRCARATQSSRRRARATRIAARRPTIARARATIAGSSDSMNGDGAIQRVAGSGASGARRRGQLLADDAQDAALHASAAADRPDTSRCGAAHAERERRARARVRDRARERDVGREREIDRRRRVDSGERRGTGLGAQLETHAPVSRAARGRRRRSRLAPRGRGAPRAAAAPCDHRSCRRPRRPSGRARAAGRAG